MPKITVIMPVYNTEEEHLRCAIESILTQSYKDFELLIVDDGSTNNALDVVNSYKDERMRTLVNKTNKGLIYTLNKALGVAKSEFIARMDADDISLETRFEKQIEFLEKNVDISLVGTSMQYFGSSKRIFTAAEEYEEIKFLMLQESIIAHPTVMFRSKAFKNLRYDENYKHAEDYELWTRALSKGLKFANLSEILLNYRIHKNQVGSKHNKTQVKNAEKARRKYMATFDSTFSERELDILINLTNERKNLTLASAKECETLLKKFLKRSIKTKFFDSRKLISWIGDVVQELKYPKVRLFSIKLGKKVTVYFAHKNAFFKNEKKIFNFGLALTCEN